MAAFREDQVAAAVNFLTNDRGLRGWIADKEDFLFQKGLSQAEVSEALRRALAGGPPASEGRNGMELVMAGFGPSAWYALSKPKRRLAPWWVLLLSGLGIGAALSLLWRFLSWRRGALQQRQAFELAAKQRRELEEPERKKLKELMSALVSGAEETREATASLKRSAEQQERLYQMSASDFRRRWEEAQRKKGKRMEIAPESWKLLRSLVASKIPSAEANAEDAKKLQEWFQDVESTLQELLGGDDRSAKRSLQTLSLILQNLLAGPASGPKSREVNVKSSRFQETFGTSRVAALRLLELAGFVAREDGTMAFPADAEIAPAERLCDLLQHALRCRERGKGVRQGHRDRT